MLMGDQSKIVQNKVEQYSNMVWMEYTVCRTIQYAESYILLVLYLLIISSV